MHTTFAALLLVITFLHGCATTPQPVHGTVVWSGTYALKESLDTSFNDPDPLNPPGKPALGGTLVRIDETEKVPAILGVKFGVIFRFDNAPGSYEIVWTFPPSGLTDPDTKTTQYEHRAKFTTSCTAGIGCAAGYHLGSPWEIVPGEWTVDIYAGGKRQIRRVFVVTTSRDKATATIRGTLAKAEGTRSVGCAGKPVALFPPILAKQIFPLLWAEPPGLKPSHFTESQRRFVRFTTCDAKSSFSFSGLDATAWTVLTDLVFKDGETTGTRAFATTVIITNGDVVNLDPEKIPLGGD